MTNEFPNNMPIIKVETIKGPNNNEVSISPERGGIITSIKLGATEILYLDENTFNDKTKNVRGGVPILFPNAGPLAGEDNPFPEIKQHGFARLSDKWKIETLENGELSLLLSSDEETKKVFPFDFEKRIKSVLKADGSLTLEQEVINKSDGDMPLAMGLHPYFKVPNEEKKNIKFDFVGGEIIEADFANWSAGGTTCIDNPKIKDADATLRVQIPGLGALIMDVSAEYRRIWIWTMPDQDFICIEPVMRDINGLIDDPAMVEPGKSLTGKITYRLE